jgi:hypothetical protein
MKKGYLEVGACNGEVVVNHPDLQPDENGVGHIVFSSQEARDFARSLLARAGEADAQREASKPPPPPTDWFARVLADGSPVTEDHREIDATTGQQKAYVVLSDEERAKGFVRPVRRTYRHRACGHITTMARVIAETYAREPRFYSGTFCCQCAGHFPVGEDGEFTWVDDGSKVGS